MVGLPSTLVVDVSRRLADTYLAAADGDLRALAEAVGHTLIDAAGGTCSISLQPPGLPDVDLTLTDDRSSSDTAATVVQIPGPTGPIGVLSVSAAPGDVQIVEAVAAVLGVAAHAASHLRRQREAMASSEQRLRLLMTQTPLGLAFVDDDLIVTEMNEALARDYAFPAADCIGRRVADLDPDLWPQLEGPLRSVFETGEPVIGLEVSGSAPSGPGVERHRMVSYYPVRDNDGKVRSVGELAVDITERRRAERSARLQGGVSELFARTLGLEDAVDAAAHIAVPEFADACLVCLISPEAHVDYFALVQHDPATGQVSRADPDTCPIDLAPGTPIGDRLASGEGVTALTTAPGIAPEGMHDLVTSLDARSVIVVPIRPGFRLRGAAAFVYTAGSHLRYREEDVTFAIEVGARLGQLVANAELADVAARAQQRLALLARAGSVVESELEVEARAEAVVRLAVPQFADHASVFLFDADSSVLRFAAGVHRDADVSARMHAVEWPDLELDSPMAVAVAVRTNEPLLRAFQPNDGPGRLISTEHPDLAASLATRSVVAVPLRQGDEVLGALFFATARAGRRYSEDDVTLVIELARIAAPAIHNALRFEHERVTAETLQRSLLPRGLPDTAGVWVAARYLPGTTGLQVGGDWHDVVVRHDRVILAIGDVVGHSIEAAVSMGRFRTVLQFAARQSGDPARILRRINEFMSASFPGDMATLLVVSYDPHLATASLASGGHLAPILRRPDGTVTSVDVPAGLPLCVEERARYEAVSIPIEPGSLIVLYTDGLVERRGEVLDEGIARLVDEVGKGGAIPEQVVDRLIGRLVPDAGAEDDVAVLAARLSIAGERLAVEFQVEPSHLGPLRRDLRHWLEGLLVPPDTAADVVLAVNEGVANAIEHAYAGREAGVVRVDGVRHADMIEVTISDQGVWRAGAGDPTRGRGFPIMRGLMDDVVVERDGGASVILRKRIGTEA